MSKLYRAAWNRAKRTFLQALVATIPGGTTISFVSGVDWKATLLSAAGVVCTAALAGLIAFLQGILKGLPEVEDDDYDEDELDVIEGDNELTDAELESSEEVE